MLLFSIISLESLSQTIPVKDYSESISRMNQILGVSSNLQSYTQHPLNSDLIGKNDSAFQKMIASSNLFPNTHFFGKPLILKTLPFTLLNDYNSKTPYGYNNGSLYPNVGYQTFVTGGFYFKLGILNVQFKPELVKAQNKAFNTFLDINKNNNSNLVTTYFHFINGIDAPERFGINTLSYAGLGQSKITAIYKGIELGISTENMWWGPGVYNSIMMSNSAPGFLHWTFNSPHPINTLLGSFEWQLIGGKLNQSGYLAFNTVNLSDDYVKLYKPKPILNRYLSAFTFNYHPKWIDGLFIGISGYDYLNIDSSYKSKSIFRRILPVFSTSSLQQNSLDVGGDGQDFAYAINIRQVFPSYKTEIYFEYARNDAAASTTDFILQPEHSTGYTLGTTRYFDLKKDQFLKVSFEITHLQNSDTFLLRDEPSWYVHSGYAPQDGYTNLGRYLGAGIGPGSNSLIFDISYYYKINSFGLKLERLVHNNDLFYYAFENTKNSFDNEWVDISSTFYSNFKLKKFLISMEFTPVFTYNYEYLIKNEIKNNHIRTSITYFFE